MSFLHAPKPGMAVRKATIGKSPKTNLNQAKPPKLPKWLHLHWEQMYNTALREHPAWLISMALCTRVGVSVPSLGPHSESHCCFTFSSFPESLSSLLLQGVMWARATQTIRSIVPLLASKSLTCQCLVSVANGSDTGILVVLCYWFSTLS